MPCCIGLGLGVYCLSLVLGLGGNGLGLGLGSNPGASVLAWVSGTSALVTTTALAYIA